MQNQIVQQFTDGCKAKLSKKSYYVTGAFRNYGPRTSFLKPQHPTSIYPDTKQLKLCSFISSILSLVFANPIVYITSFNYCVFAQRNIHREFQQFYVIVIVWVCCTNYACLPCILRCLIRSNEYSWNWRILVLIWTIFINP